LPSRIRTGRGYANHFSTDLSCHRLTHPLAAVMRCGMPHLVADHRRHPQLIFRNGQDARIDTHFAPRQAKGIGFFAVKNDKLPLRVGEIRHGSDAFTHTLHQGIHRRIFADGGLLFHLLERGQP
jgi:hypothetical protein